MLLSCAAAVQSSARSSRLAGLSRRVPPVGGRVWRRARSRASHVCPAAALIYDCMLAHAASRWRRHACSSAAGSRWQSATSVTDEYQSFAAGMHGCAGSMHTSILACQHGTHQCCMSVLVACAYPCLLPCQHSMCQYCMHCRDHRYMVRAEPDSGPCCARVGRAQRCGAV